jgi:molybdopterin converting factor small subunit
MTTDRTGRSRDGRSADVPTVTVRYWAGARVAAGVSEEQLTGTTVAEVLEAARSAHVGEPRFASVLSVCSILLGDRPVGSADLTTVVVNDGDTVEVLPPFAGG